MTSKISAPSWNVEFDSLKASYSISDIQDYFEHIKKPETIADNSSTQSFINRIKSYVVIMIKIHD